MDKNTNLRKPSNRGRGLIPVEGRRPTPMGYDGPMLAEHELPTPVRGRVQAPAYDHGLIPVVNSGSYPTSPHVVSPHGWILPQDHAPTPPAFNTILGPPPTPADQRTRLAELSKRTGISAVPRGATLKAPNIEPRFQTDSDRDVARRLLVARRQSDPNCGDPSSGLKGIFKSTKSKTRAADPKNWVFSIDELNSALGSIIPNRDAVGIAEVLIEMMNTAPSRDSIRGLSRSFSRNSLGNSRQCGRFLQEATSDGHVNMVRLLARYANQMDLNDSLRNAIDKAFPEIVKILLEYQADPGTHPQGFHKAVRNRNMLQIVELILRSPKPVGVDHVTSSLPFAIDTRSPRLVSLLIAHGAGVGDLALQAAIGTRDIDLVTRVLLGGPSEDALGGATLHALNAPTAIEKQELIERLLFAGARGEEVAETLVRAVRGGYTDIARLLVANGVSVEYKDAEALAWAVSSGQSDMAEVLLEGALDERYLNMVFSKIPDSAPDEAIYKLTSMLISRGARGDVLSIALIKYIKRRHTMVALLINNNTPVNYRDSQVLQDFITSEDITLIEALLNRRLSTLPLERSFSVAQGASRDARRQTTPKGAVGGTPALGEISLIKILIDSGADASYLNGECLQISAGQADIRVLKLLLDSRPGAEALSSAIPFAMRLDDARARFEVVKLLISAGASGDGVSQGLTEAAKIDAGNMEMITTFLEARADVNFKGGKPLQYATEFGTDQALELFITLGSPNPSSVSSALLVAIEMDAFDERKMELLLGNGALQGAIDTALVRVVERSGSYREEAVDLLLKFNADVNYMGGAVMRVAAERGYKGVLKLGVTRSPSPTTLTTAFLSGLTLRDQEERAAIAQILLEAGVIGSEVDEALVNAVRGYPVTSPLIDVLLRFRASVDHERGRCLQIAAANGDFRLIKSLLEMMPSRQSISAAFPHILTSMLDENQMVQVISLFLKRTPEKLDLNFNDPHPDSILFAALKRFPRGTGLLQALLDVGCSADQKTQCIVDEASGAEYATALLWILSQPTELIYMPALSVLLAAGANPSFQAEISKKTPLILAAEKLRGDVVDELIKYRSKVRTLDRHGRSALSYASEKGDTAIMKLILTQNAPLDDGSLHDAAREIRLDAVKLLLKHHHDPNFPSLRHDGRSALGELCLRASRNEKEDIIDTIRALLSEGAHEQVESDGRSVLLLALDNPKPFVTGAALEAGLWKNVNEEFNLYHGQGSLCYSPTVYVEHGIYSGPKSEERKRELIWLLKWSRCRDRYFALDGEQPFGAVGVPESLARLEKTRREDAARRARLQREEEEHLAKLQHEHELKLRQERKLAAQRQTASANQNAAELQHQRQVGKAKLDLDRIRRREEEVAAQRVFQRNTSYFEMQKEILRLQSGAGSNAKLLEFKHEDVE